MKQDDVTRYLGGEAELRPMNLGMPAARFIYEQLTSAKTPWYESKAQIQEGLKWGERKARKLVWVRAQMLLWLSPVERRAIELYYFEDLNYRQAATVMGLNASSVYRAVRRGIGKLRQAAIDAGMRRE